MLKIANDNVRKLKQKAYERAEWVLYEKASLQGHLLNVNLALSNICTGKCIFCPKTRGANGKMKIMPLDYAEKIADEIAQKEFKPVRGVRKINVGENGDALLNPSFIEILRYIKLKNPKIFVSLFTNFQNFKEETSEIIVKENLIDFIGVNIDGHDSQSYYAVKGIHYDTMKQNITAFLETRKKFRSRIRLQVLVLTFASYVNTIYNKLGRLPSSIKEPLNPSDLIDDFSLINDEWEKMLNPRTDVITQSGVYLWAERENVKLLKLDTARMKCPKLHRVKNECFVAPNGDWYACCWDELQNLTFGNVIERSISEVYYSKRRKMFIDLLTQKKFDEIGYPCSIIGACQSLSGKP